MQRYINTSSVTASAGQGSAQQRLLLGRSFMVHSSAAACSDKLLLCRPDQNCVGVTPQQRLEPLKNRSSDWLALREVTLN